MKVSGFPSFRPTQLTYHLRVFCFRFILLEQQHIIQSVDDNSLFVFSFDSDLDSDSDLESDLGRAQRQQQRFATF